MPDVATAGIATLAEDATVEVPLGAGAPPPAVASASADELEGIR